MSQYFTPLRYPGGKQKLEPFIREIIDENNLRGGYYVEPYAGGAGIGIQLLVNGVVSAIHLNDSSIAVFGFWKSLLRNPERFCRRVKNASLTVDEWRRQRDVLRQGKNADLDDLGFSLFYLNRCNRSGIPNGGVIGGLDQSGKWKIDARFPINELIRRIEVIAENKKKISVSNLDAEIFIKNTIPKFPRKSLIYFDPPYFRKANRLYLDHYHPSDHQRIAQLIQEKVKRPWIVSYDKEPHIIANYKSRRRFSYSIQYNASSVYIGSELFIFSDNLSMPRKSVLPFIDKPLKRMTA